jgi:hypothetical protein
MPTVTIQRRIEAASRFNTRTGALENVSVLFDYRSKETAAEDS